MTPREREQLLEDVLGGEESAALREATLQAGLRAMRWKRRKRIGAYLSVMILPWAIVFYPVKRATVETGQGRAPVKAEAKVEKISTEELFALFPNRPVALVGKPGQQELVFLDQQEKAGTP